MVSYHGPSGLVNDYVVYYVPDMTGVLRTKAIVVAAEGGLWLLAPDRRGAWGIARVEWPGGEPVALLASGHRIIAAAHTGVWLSGDGRKWEPAPGVAGREICCVAGDGNMVYAAEPAGSLFVSHDSGATWAEQPGLRSALESEGASVRALGLDPANAWTLWAAAQGGAVLRSEDAGQAWQAVGKVPAEVVALEGSHYGGPWTEALTKVAVHAATAQGFYRSLDAGAKWQLSSGGLTVLGCTAMAVRRVYGQTIFLAAFDPKGGGAIFRSVDYGYRWERVRDGLPEPGPRYTALCFDRADPYVVFAGTSDGRIFFCTEAGDLWHPLHAGLPAVRALLAL